VADDLLTRSAPSTLRRVYRTTPWWVKVAVIWLVSRGISTTLLALFASWQQKNSWTGRHPSLLAYSQLWDSLWYNIIAVSGYPSVLPTAADGHVAQNAWAFLPAYPLVVRSLMVVTTLPWAPASVAVSLLFSLGAALMFFRLMRLRLPAESAMFAVVLFCVAPISPILQVAYAESMQAFFLTLALYLLIRRRYGLLFPVVFILCLTRPSGLAFALALALHIIQRWMSRGTDPFPTSERITAIAVTAFSLAMGFVWSIVAWIVTGSSSAYTDTELAWRAPYVGYGELLPFAPWVQGSAFWSAQWGLGAFGYVLLVALVAGFGAALFLPSVRRLGSDLRFWSASYALYLLAVFFPQSSTFRLLLPLFPLLGAVAQPKSIAYRVGITVLFVAGQFGWLAICWFVAGYDWTPP
jgi:hypothetical protein